MIAREIAFIIAIYFLLIFAVYYAAHVLAIKPRIPVRQCEFVIVRAEMIHALPLSGQTPGPLFFTGLFFSLFPIFSWPYSFIKFGKKGSKGVLLIQVAIPLALILLIELIRGSTSSFAEWDLYDGSKIFYWVGIFFISQITSGLFIASRGYSLTASRFTGENVQVLGRFNATSESQALKMFLSDFSPIQRLKIKLHIQQTRIEFFYFILFLFLTSIFYIAFVKVILSMTIVIFIVVAFTLLIYLLHCLINLIRYPSNLLENFKDYPALPLGYDNFFSLDNLDL